jgi:hypothetical protein
MASVLLLSAVEQLAKQRAITMEMASVQKRLVFKFVQVSGEVMVMVSLRQLTIRSLVL